LDLPACRNLHLPREGFFTLAMLAQLIDPETRFGTLFNVMAIKIYDRSDRIGILINQYVTGWDTFFFMAQMA
jgi:hypothetical protein